MNRLWKLLPFAILLVALVGAVFLVKSRAKPETRDPDPVYPVVNVHRVSIEDIPQVVTSQGTVSPRSQSALVPEVAGRVIEISPAFAVGGFFEEGQWLLRIDPHDYRQALVAARATQAQARLRLAQVEAEAELAREEWDALGQGDATPLTLLEPQLAEARASLEAARALVEQAQKNLSRTELRAPYAGRVQTKEVDRGQVVSPGAPLALIYAVDYAEVRLPLPDDELAFVDLPLTYRGESGTSHKPRVVLRADFGGKTHEWSGRIVRTEGVIDPVSRMVHAVAQVENPYGRREPGRPPLAVGLYVEAEIHGKTIEDVAEIPRGALRPDGTLLVIDADDRVRIRNVTIARELKETLLVESGLADGERVCTSPLAVVVDGMRVVVREDDA